MISASGLHRPEILPKRVGHFPLTICYARRSFLLLAPTFVLDRHHAPYRRLAATLLISRKNPFDLETDAGTLTSVEVALIAPKVLRKRLVAVDSDLAVLDIAMDSPAFRRIAARLGDQSLISCPRDRFSSLFPLLANAQDGNISAADFHAIQTESARILAQGGAASGGIDPRVSQTMKWIDELPLDAVKLEQLAKKLGLSKSRLRHLFSARTGSTVSHYARWVAVWRAVNLWSPSTTWTEIAHQCGFHDLAHLDHAFIDVFGLAPSTIFDPARVLIRRFE